MSFEERSDSVEGMEVDKCSFSGSDVCSSAGETSSSDTGHEKDSVEDLQAKYNLRTSSLINRIQTERKRKEPKQPKPKAKPPPLSKYRRKTANARERTRMQEINQAYEDLRNVVPDFPEDEGKTTKITTLRLALNYIAALRDILGYEDLYVSESEYNSRSPSTSSTSVSDSCASPCGGSPPYPQGNVTDEGRVTPGQLDSEGESLVSS